MWYSVEIKMPHILTSVKRSSANYSNCPLKKRPIKYELVEESDSDVSYKGKYLKYFKETIFKQKYFLRVCFQGGERFFTFFKFLKQFY